jgi:hypothetical protein
VHAGAGVAKPLRVGGTATGTVAAVAAVKAALAGFGTTGWQQQVKPSRHSQQSLAPLMPVCILDDFLSTTISHSSVVLVFDKACLWGN